MPSNILRGMLKFAIYFRNLCNSISTLMYCGIAFTQVKDHGCYFHQSQPDIIENVVVQYVLGVDWWN